MNKKIYLFSSFLIINILSGKNILIANEFYEVFEPVRLINKSEETCNGYSIYFKSFPPFLEFRSYLNEQKFYIRRVNAAKIFVTYPNGIKKEEIGISQGWGNFANFQSQNFSYGYNTGGFQIKEKQTVIWQEATHINLGDGDSGQGSQDISRDFLGLIFLKINQIPQTFPRTLLPSGKINYLLSFIF